MTSLPTKTLPPGTVLSAKDFKKSPPRIPLPMPQGRSQSCELVVTNGSISKAPSITHDDKKSTCGNDSIDRVSIDSSQADVPHAQSLRTVKKVPKVVKTNRIQLSNINKKESSPGKQQILQSQSVSLRKILQRQSQENLLPKISIKGHDLKTSRPVERYGSCDTLGFSRKSSVNSQ